MKEQLFTLIGGVAGQIAYQDKIKLSEKEKASFIDSSNWEFKGANSHLIILNEMLYLFEYKHFFVQIQFTVKNNTVVEINIITDKTKEITYDNH